jgi:hypothetical protein
MRFVGSRENKDMVRWWFCEKREDEHQMLVVECSLACLELRGDHDKDGPLT